MQRSQWVANGVTAIFVCCAVIVTTLVVRRELFSTSIAPAPAAAPAGVDISRPTHVNHWQSLASEGVRFGAPRAPVTIVEFSDFQCPYCRAMHFALRQFMERHPGQLSVVYRHFPIEQAHPFAMAAAVAFECANAQQRADAFERTVFEHQDSLGHSSWERLAAMAGVPDIAAFDACRSTHGPLDRIKRDGMIAQDIGVSGTPTLVLGDELIAGAIPVDTLQRWIDRYAASPHPQ